MSIFRKISIFTMLFVMAIAFLAPVKVDAATVGQVLANPEEGWQRYDDTDSKIIYKGTWGYSATSNLYYQNQNQYTTNVNSYYKFKFYGTKLRLLVGTNTAGHCTQVSVNIDGNVYYYNENSTQFTGCFLAFEKKGLSPGYHTVIVTNTQDTKYMDVDAIDIDDSGYLVDYYRPTNLIATSGNHEINLSWDVLDGATSYSIKRSTTAGGPYINIATGSAVTFIDSDIIPGKTYYYVVSSIVSGTESSNSNEASATLTDEPTPPGHIGNISTLILTMTNGDDKVYNLPLIELDNFLTWYDSKSDGTGKAYYVFTKTESIAPYVSVKDYISFDKISNFEVKEYNQ